MNDIPMTWLEKVEKLEARIQRSNEERFAERQTAAGRIEELEETLKEEKKKYNDELRQMGKDMTVALSAAKNYEQEQVQTTRENAKRRAKQLRNNMKFGTTSLYPILIH